MKLLLLRHGIAVEPGTPGYEDDDARPLTAEGRRKLELVARALARLELVPEVILTSPLVRARQTAEIVAAGLERTRHLHDCRALAPGGNPVSLLALVKKNHARAGVTMLVGHQPDLGELASHLLTGNALGAALEFKKAGLAVFEWNRSTGGGDAALQMLLPPRVLTRLA